jgi:hypothetical protein
MARKDRLTWRLYVDLRRQASAMCRIQRFAQR